MKLDSKKYLFDIKYSINLIEEFVSDNGFDQYKSDLKTKVLLKGNLELLGKRSIIIRKLRDPNYPIAKK
jgi:uncharacterized protein with HEPN domain